MKSDKLHSINPSSSKDLLRQFIGKTVIDLIRYSWWRKEEISAERNISKEKSFSLTSGPLAVVFECGSILGIASEPGINSIIVWLDHAACQKNIMRAMSEDPELFPINAKDKVYSEHVWCKFSNRTLSGFSILKNKEMNWKEMGLPSELGLCFHFEGADRFVASHGLHNGTDDFSVIVDDQIAPIFYGKLKEFPL